MRGSKTTHLHEMATPNSLAGVIKTQAALITSQASVIKDVVEENQNLKMKINQIQDGQSNNGNKLQVNNIIPNMENVPLLTDLLDL